MKAAQTFCRIWIIRTKSHQTISPRTITLSNQWLLECLQKCLESLPCRLDLRRSNLCSLRSSLPRDRNSLQCHSCSLVFCRCSSSPDRHQCSQQWLKCSLKWYRCSSPWCSRWNLDSLSHSSSLDKPKCSLSWYKCNLECSSSLGCRLWWCRCSQECSSECLRIRDSQPTTSPKWFIRLPFLPVTLCKELNQLVLLRVTQRV